MKRFLGIIGALGLVATSSSSVISCGQEMYHWHPEDIPDFDPNLDLSIGIVWYLDVKDTYGQVVPDGDQNTLYIYLNKTPKTNIKFDDIKIYDTDDKDKLVTIKNDKDRFAIMSRNGDAGNFVNGYCIRIRQINDFDFVKNHTYRVEISGVKPASLPDRNTFVFGHSSSTH